MYSFILAYSKMPIGRFSSRSTSTSMSLSARFASCHRTEYCCMRNSKPPQVRLVRAECVKDVLEV